MSEIVHTRMALGKSVHVGHEQCAQVLAIVADDGAEFYEPRLTHRILDGLRLNVLPAARSIQCHLSWALDGTLS